MATIRLMPLHMGKKHTAGQAIRKIIDYVENPDKTENRELVSAYACDPRTADAEFMLSRREYYEMTGCSEKKSEVIAYHFRQSFRPGEVTPEEANRIGYELAKRFTHGNHAFVVATHTDKKHIHNHIIWNAVTLEHDRKFRNFWGSFIALRRLSDTLCLQNGLSIVESPGPHGATYDKWQGDQVQLTHRDMLRMAIDAALEKKPADFDMLLKMLQDDGWEVKRGKHVSLRLAGQARFKRLDSLGASYSEELLRAVLAGEKAHTPQKKRMSISPKEKKVSLLVDIQAKLQQGKSPGYERWAKVFNLKQMAHTMNFLSEHGLLSYEVLAQRTDEAVARHAEQSRIIKAAEKRMEEIGDLKAHIIHYIKTRDVYAAYRQSGYSKKFLAEHEQEIRLHKEAKQAFDALGMKKLPSLKSLQTEYETVLAEKKTAYAEYRKARDEMRELLTVKANVDRLLNQENDRNTTDRNRNRG